MLQLLLRQQLEQRERKQLAPYASHSVQSQGRKYLETEDWQRTCYQRDRDRVIHARAFRRLKGKTQVFVAHHGDHFRTRLTHTMEVAQIARDLSRSLGLNEDLAETIALAHDLGHTPFGHAGEQAMRELMHRFGLGFEHNQQSRRIVEQLEEKSPQYAGLNLSFEVLDGLHKHDRKNGNYPSLEAQIVDLADSIAYLSHDIDDGLREQIFSAADLHRLPLWQRVEANMPADDHGKQWLTTAISTLIKIMSRDLLENTLANLIMHNIETVAGVQSAPERCAVFSPQIGDEVLSLRHFLYAKMYRHPQIAEESEQGGQVIKQIFFHLLADDSLLPRQFTAVLATGERREIVIKDFIAGMTDDFALEFAAKL